MYEWTNGQITINDRQYDLYCNSRTPIKELYDGSGNLIWKPQTAYAKIVYGIHLDSPAMIAISFSFEALHPSVHVDWGDGNAYRGGDSTFSHDYASGDYSITVISDSVTSIVDFSDPIKREIRADGWLEAHLHEYSSYTYDSVDMKVYGWFDEAESEAALRSVYLEGDVRRINRGAFEGAINLESVTLCPQLRQVDYFAFGNLFGNFNLSHLNAEGCADLFDRYISQHVKKFAIRFMGSAKDFFEITWNNYAFFGASVSIYDKDGAVIFDERTTNLALPDGLKSVYGYLMLNMCWMNPRVKSVTVPDGLTDIGAYAFAYCLSVETIRLPESVNYIGRYAFYMDIALERIEIPRGVSFIGVAAFAYCFNLANVILPDSVTHIYDYAFYACGEERYYTNFNVNFPNSLTYIGDYAFYACYYLGFSMEILEIPESVTHIGAYAFKDAFYLDRVKINKNAEVGDNAFDCAIEYY